MATLVDYLREASGVHPPNNFPGYASTAKRAPKLAPIWIEHTLSEITGPALGKEILRPGDDDLTHYNGGEAVGQRIIVHGRVLDEDARPVRNTIIEIWQANACGRYQHEVDQHDAPLDPYFSGGGRVITDNDGGYKFMTIKPGSYPWKNHYNAWRPCHIHYSLFGPGFATRLVTQMYFPGDPLIPLDPIYNSVPDPNARHAMVSSFDIETTIPEYALGYSFDFVLRGRGATPMVGQG